MSTLASSSRPLPGRPSRRSKGLLVRARLLPILGPLVLVQLAMAQPTGENREGRLVWWSRAKLGIFIHWGYYAVQGVAESWSMWNKQITFQEYMNQSGGFTAERYDPAEWARLFKESGAKYAVLTSKHHDGVCLWPSSQTRLNVVEKTPAGRDLIKPYSRALRDEGLKVGLYFSLCDWSHPDYSVPFSRANSPDGSYRTDDYPRLGQEKLTS